MAADADLQTIKEKADGRRSTSYAQSDSCVPTSIFDNKKDDEKNWFSSTPSLSLEKHDVVVTPTALQLHARKGTEEVRFATLSFGHLGSVLIDFSLSQQLQC